AFGREIFAKALGATESADPHRRGVSGGRGGAAPERKPDDPNGGFGPTVPPAARLPPAPPDGEAAPLVPGIPFPPDCRAAPLVVHHRYRRGRGRGPDADRSKPCPGGGDGVWRSAASCSCRPAHPRRRAAVAEPVRARGRGGVGAARPASMRARIGRS